MTNTMMELNVCPSTLEAGYRSFSQRALKALFDGNHVSHILPYYRPDARIFALDKGLFKEGMDNCDTQTLSRTDFEEFGRRIGLTDRIIKREIDRFCDEYAMLDTLIDNSFLSDALKQSYRKSFKYRKATLKG